MFARLGRVRIDTWTYESCGASEGQHGLKKKKSVDGFLHVTFFTCNVCHNIETF